MTHATGKDGTGVTHMECFPAKNDTVVISRTASATSTLGTAVRLQPFMGPRLFLTHHLHEARYVWFLCQPGQHWNCEVSGAVVACRHCK